MDKLTANQVRHRLSYDPMTGVFRWKNPHPKSPVKPGDIAGTVTKFGYVVICVDRQYKMAHQLAWLYMTGEWPDQEIDHRDTVGTNNAWRNLRLATRTQNARNKRVRADSVSRLKGVTFNRRKGKFAAYIKDGGKQRHLGYFSDPLAAHAVYQREAIRIAGEFARAA